MTSVLEHAIAYTFSPGRKFYLDGDTTLSSMGFGVVRLPHRMWNVGDHVLCYYSNGGGERWPTYGLSSKLGSFVGGLYVQWQRYPGRPPMVHGPRGAERERRQTESDKAFYAKQRKRGREHRLGPYDGIVELVDFQPPSELADVPLRRLADSDVRRLVEALRVAYSACR